MDTSQNPSAAVSNPWSSLVLPDDVLQKLKMICRTAAQAERLLEQHVALPRVLIWGPPGVGKTQIARAMIQEIGLNVVAPLPLEFRGQYLGQPSQKTRRVFELARAKAPCLLLIDEFEITCPPRSSKKDSVTEEIVGEVIHQLVEIQQSPILVMAIAQDLEKIDPMVLGRFGEKVHIALPDLQQRQKMFELFLAEETVAFDVPQLAQEIAPLTEGLSGRDMNYVIRRAREAAANRAGDGAAAILTREDLVAQAEEFQSKWGNRRAASQT